MNQFDMHRRRDPALNNIGFLLQCAIEHGWFSSYGIEHKANNKDFHFCLAK
jgi:hypothetical protein